MLSKFIIIKSSIIAVAVAISFSCFSTTTSHSLNTSSEQTSAYEVTYRGDIWRIADDELTETLRMLEDYGGSVLNHRDDLYLVMYPENAVTNIVNSRVLRAPRKGGQRPGFIPSPKATPAMDVARTFNNVADIYAGTGLPQAFDGKGVVVGFSDTGFDTRHVNFMNVDGAESRIKMFSHYNITEGKIDRLTDPTAIHEYWSDNEDNTHATHVAGIMAGRGNPSPYIGMAPGAEIAATTSDLSDVGILAGVEDIIAYAKSVDKPCVINLSLGNYNGAHDGTSLFCQYLDKCASDAIIVVSAGNTGGTNGHLGYTFKENDEKLKFRLFDNRWKYLDIISFVDIYSRDSSPMRFQMFTMDVKLTGWPINWTSEEIDFTKTPVYVITADPNLDDGKGIYHYDEKFAEYFTGNIYFEGGIDPENGRYCVKMYCDAHTDIIVSDTSKWGRYQLGGYVIGNEGQQVDLFADCQYSYFKDNSVSIKPDSNFSISDMATGHNTITVGAYWTQGDIPMYNGDNWGGGTPGDVASYSGYGTLLDGRVTPLTIAPGGPIVSSTSGKYVQQHGSAGCSWNYENEFWNPNTGTSMASPYVAGAIATWLQANPHLSGAEAKDIIEATNDFKAPVSTHPAAANTEELTYNKSRLANGFFRPYDGLRMVVDRMYTNVENILGKSLFACYARGELLISNPDKRDVHVDIYTVAGSKIASVNAGNDDKISINRNLLNSGNYKGVGICRITASGATSESIKILFD